MEVCLNLIVNGYHIFSYLISKKYRFCPRVPSLYMVLYTIVIIISRLNLYQAFVWKSLICFTWCLARTYNPALPFCCALSSILVACISAIQTCFGLSNSIFLSSHSSISFMEACATNPSNWYLSGWWHRDVLSLGWKSYIFFFCWLASILKPSIYFSYIYLPY